MADNLPSIKQVLRSHGLMARKPLGQHFLPDMNLTDKIANLATGRKPNDKTIIEIGPGPGGLSRSILKTGANLIVIEMDERFIPILEQIKTVYDKLQIINANALKIDLAGLSKDRPLGICANLPYNIGTKLLINWLLARPLFWDKMVLMLQREVAERIVAAPSEKHYGRLAVLAGSVAERRIAFTVPAKAFIPPPKIESAVIVLDALPKEKRYKHLNVLGEITAAAFGQRRKMLRASLKYLAKKHELNPEDWLAKAGIDGKLRPQELAIKQFHSLADILLLHQGFDKRAKP